MSINNKCIFCHCLPVAWPDNVSSYAKEYSLCEYHMKPVLDDKSARVYSADDVRRAELRKIVYDKIYGAEDDIINYIEENYGDDGHSDHDYTYLYETLGKVVVGCNRDIYADMPYNLSDAGVDACIAHRIKSLAVHADKNKIIKRCLGVLDNAPDGNCTNYAGDNRADGLCNQCAKKGAKKNIIDTTVFDVLNIIRQKIKDEKCKP